MEENNSQDTLLTIKEVATLLKVDKQQVYRYMKTDIDPLPYVLVSDKTRRIRKKDFTYWVARKVINSI